MKRAYWYQPISHYWKQEKINLSFTLLNFYAMISTVNIFKDIKENKQSVIQELHDNLFFAGRKLGLASKVTYQDYQEAVIDAVMVFIHKVNTGQYQDLGVQISYYMMKILRFKLLASLRKNAKQYALVNLDESIHVSEEKEENDRLRIVQKFMNLLRPQERGLIELTFFAGMSDKEIYEKDLCIYSSVDSIKTQRYKIVKKLTNLVKREYSSLAMCY